MGLGEGRGQKDFAPVTHLDSKNSSHGHGTPDLEVEREQEREIKA